MTPLEPRAQELAEKIAARRRFDERWGAFNFGVAQILLWIAVLGSFGVGIASATSTISPILIGVLAAIPGAVIVIDSTFSFARRSNWHHMMRARLDLLENSLRYEGASVESVSKALGELSIEMETRYPGAHPEDLMSLRFRRALHDHNEA
jgi:hypothetical protein